MCCDWKFLECFTYKGNDWIYYYTGCDQLIALANEDIDFEYCPWCRKEIYI